LLGGWSCFRDGAADFGGEACRDDLHGAEDLKIEQRLRRGVDLRGRVRRSRSNVDRAKERPFRDLLLARPVAVRIEPRERDRAKDRGQARNDREAVVDGVLPDVDLCL